MSFLLEGFFATFFYPIIWWNIMSPQFLQKDGTGIVFKGLIMLKDSEFRKLAKETPYVYC
jgi:hypothetical protein